MIRKWVIIWAGVLVVVGMVCFLWWGLVSPDGRVYLGLDETVDTCGSVQPERIDVYNYFGDHDVADVHEVPSGDIDHACGHYLMFSGSREDFKPEELANSPVILHVLKFGAKQEVVRIVLLRDRTGLAILTKNGSYYTRQTSVNPYYASTATKIPRSQVPQ